MQIEHNLSNTELIVFRASHLRLGDLGEEERPEPRFPQQPLELPDQRPPPGFLALTGISLKIVNILHEVNQKMNSIKVP